jgi:DNA-binding NtrC family response regulator
VIEAIRKVNPRCIRLVLTGYPDLESALQGIHHHVDDFIVKPSDIPGLLAAMTEKLEARKPKARILSVSHDEVLLRTRHMLLEHEGYEVVSTLGFDSSVKECEKGGFDVFVLGHSIDHEEKRELVDEFRRACPAPIISLRRNMGEQPVDGADFHIDTDPESLLQTVDRVLQSRMQNRASMK